MEDAIPQHESNADRLQRLSDERKKVVPCKWCGQLVKMKQGQRYCSNTCRTSSHALERATKEQQWAEERKEYIHEIALLRKRIIELGG